MEKTTFCKLSKINSFQHASNRSPIYTDLIIVDFQYNCNPYQVGTTITLKRLLKRGYEGMFTYYKRITPHLNELLYIFLRLECTADIMNEGEECSKLPYALSQFVYSCFFKRQSSKRNGGFETKNFGKMTPPTPVLHTAFKGVLTLRNFYGFF